MAMLVLATSGHIFPVGRVGAALVSQQLGQVGKGLFWWYLDPHVRITKRGAWGPCNTQKAPPWQ